MFGKTKLQIKKTVLRMGCYNRISSEEREKIYLLQKNNKTQLEIAFILGRSQSSISYELARCKSDSCGYLPDRATRLDAPLRGIPRESLDKLSPFEELGNIINLIRKTTFELPDPEFSSNLKMLNSKMESLKSNLPHPEDLDNVPQDQVQHQSTRVNTAIHTLTSDYLKQDYHPEIVANVLFSQWLRLSVFYGISEKEWQKTDYYLPEILAAVRHYIPKIIKTSVRNVY